MILWHFTDAEHGRAILAAGQIRPFPWYPLDGGEPAPAVIWADERKARFCYRFSDAISPADRENVARRTRFRFTIDVPEDDALPWRYWATLIGAPRSEIRRICNCRRPKWRVIERPVPASEWDAVRDMDGKKWLMSS